MGESNGWRSSRYIALLVVLAVHFAMIALWVMGSRTSEVFASADPTLQLILLPPMPPPKTRADARPQRPAPNMAVSVAPPMLASPAPSGTSSGLDDSGGAGRGGVNWAAEARRAVEAFEIRRDEHLNEAMLSSSPWDGWWPPRGRHAGDRSRTDTGDWIVWIDADCYQVASWHAGTPAHEADRPRTICVGDSGALRGEQPDQAAADKKVSQAP